MYLHVFSLFLSIGRPAFITLPSSQNKHERENVTFPCFATGDPTPSIEWIFNDTLVINSSNEKYQIGLFGESNFGSLTVQDLEFPNTGVYICRASNEFGSLNATAVELGVQGIGYINTRHHFLFCQLLIITFLIVL